MKLWKDNRTDKEYELSYKQILDKFKESDYYKQWLDVNSPIPLDRLLITFLTSKTGLSSVFEKEDFDNLYDYIDKRVR